MKKTNLILVIVFCGLFCCIPDSKAELVTIGITAEVTNVADPLAPLGFLEGINVGDTIKGTYTYDTLTPDKYPQWPDIGVYIHRSPPCGISLEIGGFIFKTDPEDVYFPVTIMNGDIVEMHDAYKIVSGHNLPLHNGVWGMRINLELYDSTFSALSSDALPTTAPVLDDWETCENDIYIYGNYPGYNPREYNWGFKAHLTSAFLIPEPTTLFFFGFGFFFLRKRCDERWKIDDGRIKSVKLKR